MSSLLVTRLFLFSLCIPFLLAATNFASLQQQVLGSVQKLLGFETTALPSVKIPQATLVGTYIDDGDFPAPVEAFLGVPYARSPVGPLRFAKSQPLTPSNATFAAQKYGPRCPGKQLLPPGGGPDIWSEDCLTANIFRPQNLPESKKVPVMVYIHGGAFNRGTAKMHNTASMVAWATQPFVAVSFNYRIGALGFLNSELTHKEGLLNLGLWDQVHMLEWVRENIAAFGGDVDDVTLVGLSAGAHSIGHHILNTNTPPLFHKAVIESGGPTSRALHPWNSTLHATQFDLFLTETGCSSLPSASILQCLRNVSEAVIVEASNTVFAHWNPSVRWSWQPVIDDILIHRRPLDAWKSGNWNKVPILTGFNHNEGTMYVPKTTSSSTQFRDFFKTLLPQLDEDELDEIDALYPDPSKDAASPYKETRDLDVGAQFKRVEAAYGHYAYVCPVRQTAHYASAPTSTPPIYLYHWALNRTVLGGANHGDQMWYETFDPSTTSISAFQRELAGTFHDYVVSFVLAGDPNAVQGRWQRPRWEEWKEGKKTMVFGRGNDERAGGQGEGVVAELVEDKWAEKECEFWSGVEKVED